MPSDDKPASRAKVAATVIFYLVAAIAMVVANKWVLNGTKTPLFFLLTQLIIACVLFLACHVLGFLKLPRTLDMHIVRGLAPLIVCNVLGLSFNNYCLKYVDASFYQVARGLVLPITVATSAVLIHTRPSVKVLLASALVTAGFFVGVLLDSASSAGSSLAGSASPSVIGIFFGVLSSFTTALLAVVIKSCLPVVGNSALDLAWYNNLLSAVALAPLIILAGEGPDVLELLLAPSATSSQGMDAFQTFIYGSAITGLFGFLINIAGFMSIKVTSPITHMVSSAVKGVLQSILGVWFFHDVISSGRATSIALILFGSIYYTWVKNQEVTERERRENSLPTTNSQKGAYEPVPLKEREN